MAHKRAKIVNVEWIDSSSTLGWGRKPESTLKCSSIGHLVDETKQKITIAQNYDHDNGTYGQFTEIPKVAITKKRFVKI